MALVSIIVPCHNKAQYIEESINSILSQSYFEFELIIADDCSSDASLSIAEMFAKDDKRIKILRNPFNQGANVMRNQGLSCAKGEFVIFVDADDILKNGSLAMRVSMIESMPQLDFAVFPMQVFRIVPGDSASVWQPNSGRCVPRFLSHNLPWQTMQPIWRRDFLLQTGGWDESFERLQDVELHTRALLQPGVKFEVFPGTPDCYFRIDEGRKNFKTAEFLGRWVRSAVKYYNKFYPLVPSGMRKYLLGTIYKTHTQLSYHLRRGEIDPQEFGLLEKELTSVFDQHKVPVLKRKLFDLASVYKTRLPRVPGINRMLEALLTHF